MKDNQFAIRLERKNLSALGLMCILYYPLFNAGITSLFSVFSLPGIGIFYSVILAAEVIIIYGAMLTNARENIVPIFAIYSFAILLYLLTFIVYPENQSVLMETVRNMFLFCIPAFMLAYFIDDFGKLWEYLQKYSYIIVICGVLYVLYFGDADATYSMWLGYQLTIPAMILMWKIFQRKRGLIWNILFFATAAVTILIKGSRGPVVILLVYFVVCMIQYKIKIENGTKKHLMSIKMGRNWYSIWGLSLLIITIFFAIYCLVNVETLSADLYDLFLKYGYDSRTLRVLSLKDALSYTAGRDDYFETSIQLILNNPILGYGLAGDCVQIGKSFGVSKQFYSGMYAHNIILELFLHFGVFIGGGLLLSYIVLVIKRLLKARNNKNDQDLLIVIIVLAVIQFMISANYLESTIFWLLLGLAFSKKSSSKHILLNNGGIT